LPLRYVAAVLVTALVVGAVLPLAASSTQPVRAQDGTRPAPVTRLHLPMVMRALPRASLPVIATAPPAAPTATATTEAATTTPTLSPTQAPTEAPTQAPTDPPTAPPTPALACENLVANGDFEQGARDWTLTVTTQEQPLSLAIVRRAEGPIPPHGGDTYAYLGGLDDTSFTLHSRRLPRFETEGIVRATYSYWAALITTEQPNRRPGDRLRPYIDAGRRAYVEDAARSEEDLRPAREWQHVEVDVTDHLDRGAQHVGFEVVTDRAKSSWFYLDDVSLEICRAP
jgi:hypothetical protein